MSGGGALFWGCWETESGESAGALGVLIKRKWGGGNERGGVGGRGGGGEIGRGGGRDYRVRQGGGVGGRRARNWLVGVA